MIAGRFQLYSMKFTIDAWLLRLLSIVFCPAHGEIDDERQARPEAAAALLTSRAASPLPPAVPHWPEVGFVALILPLTVFVRLSAPLNDGLTTPL